MLSRNNHIADYRHLQRHYALRKLSIGVASVLLSTTVYLGVSQVTAAADKAVQPVDQTQVQPNVAQPRDGQELSLAEQPAGRATPAGAPAPAGRQQPADVVPPLRQDVSSEVTNNNVSQVSVRAAGSLASRSSRGPLS